MRLKWKMATTEEQSSLFCEISRGWGQSGTRVVSDSDGASASRIQTQLHNIFMFSMSERKVSKTKDLKQQDVECYCCSCQPGRLSDENCPRCPNNQRTLQTTPSCHHTIQSCLNNQPLCLPQIPLFQQLSPFVRPSSRFQLWHWHVKFLGWRSCKNQTLKSTIEVEQ